MCDNSEESLRAEKIRRSVGDVVKILSTIFSAVSTMPGRNAKIRAISCRIVPPLDIGPVAVLVALSQAMPKFLLINI